MRIKFFPFQAHCFAFGGFEVQMLAAFSALRKINVNCEKIDFWDKDGDFDIAHFWGLGFPGYENVRWAKLSGKKVVTTVLLPYYHSLLHNLRFSVSKRMHTQKFHFEIMQLSDKVVVVNDTQKEICTRLYRLPGDKVETIPNIVSGIFFDRSAAGLPPLDKPYVLTVGNICKRKNQVALCEAAVTTNTPLVVIGKILPGEEAYGQQFRQLVERYENIHWIPGLKSGSAELAGYYHNCLGFALPSYEETQPISLLEAIACRKPILTADKAYAQQKFFKHAIKVKPAYMRSLESGLTLLKEKQCSSEENSYIHECLENNVAASYKNLYEQLLN